MGLSIIFFSLQSEDGRVREGGDGLDAQEEKS